ncbi:MAG: triose-phosphate isomerase [Deferribacteraceae bacterium]|jgi:triosephosphate isomerase|nr:triose-phosphate isomerase [Deferribacteraceae bacterium]
MRKPLIAGNWKMFLTVEEAQALAKSLCDSDIDYSKCDVLLAPSFTNIYAVHNVVKAAGKPIKVAAQNVYTEDSGAFTGEVSLPMVKSAGADSVILGHSERRNVFGETDEFINAKVHKVLKAGMSVILCVGELLEERESGNANSVVVSQLTKGLANVASLSDIVIAYEPVWAIGTGKTASPADAQAMHKVIRTSIEKLYGKAAASEVRILYGGSVKPDNVTSLMAEDDIDGALVGGASLKAVDFLKIINY